MNTFWLKLAWSLQPAVSVCWIPLILQMFSILVIEYESSVPRVSWWNRSSLAAGDWGESCKQSGLSFSWLPGISSEDHHNRYCCRGKGWVKPDACIWPQVHIIFKEWNFLARILEVFISIKYQIRKGIIKFNWLKKTCPLMVCPIWTKARVYELLPLSWNV